MHVLIARYANAAFVYKSDAGDAVARRLIRLGFPENHIFRVHNGYDGCEIAAIPPSQRVDACLLGGLRPGKGLHEIVPIWSRVCAVLPDVQLAVVGNISENYRSMLTAEIRNAGLNERIRLCGGIGHPDAIALLKSATVMIAPSLEEGWGIAVCEALACGIPVAAYDLPTYRSLFKAGIVFAPLGDRIALASNVVNLLLNEDLRKEL